jgi:hypothetical protein
MPERRDPTRHLDDDELLDVVDGVAGARALAHVGGCGSCAARLSAQRAAADAVAAPVPPVPPAVRAAAVAAALHAADGRVGTARRGPAASNVAHGRWRRAPLVTFAAAAAAVLVVVGSVAAVRHDGGGHDDVAAKSATTAADAGREDAFAADAAGGASLAAPVVEDLGPLDDASLRRAVDERLALETAARTAAPAAAGATTTGGTGAAAAPAPATPSDQGSPASGPEVDACDAALHARVRSLPPRAFAAVATWQDVPAVVLAYRVGERIAAYVTAREGCRTLHVARFRPGSAPPR